MLQQTNTLNVEANPLTLRAHQQGENLNITVNSNIRDTTITLEVYEKEKIVYRDLIEIKDTEVTREMKADKDYTIKATLRKENQIIETKTIKPETEEEFNPTNIDPIILTPVALMDLYLIGNLLGALGIRRKT